MKKAKKLFAEAVAKVESKSIREWASSEHNAPIWEDYVAKMLKKNPNLTQEFVTMVITAEAIGLW